MSIQLLFCCVCNSQLLENGLAASCASAAADWLSACDGGAPFEAWVRAIAALARHVSARTTPSIVMTFCRVMFDLSLFSDQ
jgi:hypothetical protein